MNVSKKVVLFKTLADENRLKMLEMLQKGNMCLGALANGLKISRAAISQHMRLLKSAGLVSSTKKGPFVHYCLEEKNISTMEKKFGISLGLKKSISKSRPVCDQKEDMEVNSKKCSK